MCQPAGGQQLLPEFWIELDGGMEASTPRADVDGAVGIASEDWREASRRHCHGNPLWQPDRP